MRDCAQVFAIAIVEAEYLTVPDGLRRAGVDGVRAGDERRAARWAHIIDSEFGRDDGWSRHRTAGEDNRVVRGVRHNPVMDEAVRQHELLGDEQV